MFNEHIAQGKEPSAFALGCLMFGHHQKSEGMVYKSDKSDKSAPPSLIFHLHHTAHSTQQRRAENIYAIGTGKIIMHPELIFYCIGDSLLRPAVT